MRLTDAAPWILTIAIGGLASAAGAARAQAVSMDRYGGGASAGYAAGPYRAYSPPAGAPARRAPTPYPPPAATARYATAADAGLRTRFLTWSGKAEATAPTPPARPVAYVPTPYVPTPNAAYRPYAPPPAPVARAAYAPPQPEPAQTDAAATPMQPAMPGPPLHPPGYRTAYAAPAPVQAPQPTYAFAPPPVSARALPTSVYADAGPSIPAAAASAYTSQPGAPTSTARLYSVHRDFGMTPDPAPIPPQFFAATADLSAPETPEVAPRATATAAGAAAARAAQNTARLAAGAAQ